MEMKEEIEDDETGEIVTRKSILLMEDNLEIADSIKTKLEATGYDVLTVFDGLAGLAIARKERPDLIILDLLLPGLVGYHVCRLLKFDERYRDIPVVILTTKRDEELRRLGTKAGADLFLAKPFDIATLLSQVKRLTGVKE